MSLTIQEALRALNQLKEETELDEFYRHDVNDELVYEINRNLGINIIGLSNQSILFIGQPSPLFCARLLARDNTLYIIADNLEDLDTLIDNNHWYVDNEQLKVASSDEGASMETELSKVSNIHFNYVIANPPYKYGSTTTDLVLKKINFDHFINLMPLSKYRSRDLYKHVLRLESIESRLFKDAAVQYSLCVAELTKETLDQTYFDIAVKTYKVDLQDYYKLNSKCNVPYDYLANPKYSTPLEVERTFQITKRTGSDGVHKVGGKAWDLAWNLEDDETSFAKDDSNQCYGSIFLVFKTPREKKNLSRFWYYNPLMNQLIKGLNTNTSRMTIAIPNIDWSKDRDYEHLTLEDIINILKEENPNVTE